MAELNRQVLINLHSDAKELTDVNLVEFGEIAIKHDTPIGATIYTKTTDGNVAKFITDLAVDAKIKPVADELTAHKSAYGLKVSQLEDADGANAQAISAETQARKDADNALGGRLTTVEALLGVTDTDDSIVDRLSAVETKANENAQLISAETETRATEDGKLSTAIENMDAAYKAADTQIKADFAAADTQIRTDFAAADTQIRTDFAAADTQIRTDFATADANLLGKDSDESSAETIWGAKKAAAEALTAAQNAQATANQGVTDAAAAQETADDAKGKIDAFLANADLTEQAIDTLKEIQAYITSDGEVAADMLAAIDANKTAAENAQKAAASAQTYAEGVASNLTKEIERAKAAEEANTNAIAAADAQIRIDFAAADTQIRTDFAAADANLLGKDSDESSAETIWGAKKAAAEALTAAQNAQATANQGVTDAAAALTYAKQVETDYKAADEAMDAAYKAADAVLLGKDTDEAGAATIKGALKSAAAAQETANTNKTNLENLGAVVVKTAEITGVGLGRTETITGLVSGNKLTFDFSNLVIDCGTF